VIVLVSHCRMKAGATVLVTVVVHSDSIAGYSVVVVLAPVSRPRPKALNAIDPMNVVAKHMGLEIIPAIAPSGDFQQDTVSR
jgi:hypothetical protein